MNFLLVTTLLCSAFNFNLKIIILRLLLLFGLNFVVQREFQALFHLFKQLVIHNVVWRAQKLGYYLAKS